MSLANYQLNGVGFDGTFNVDILDQPWIVSNSASGLWHSVSMSDTGQYAVACIYGGLIYYSNTYGRTWIATTASSNWRSVSIDASGQNAVAVAD